MLYKVVPSEAPRILKEIGTDYKNVIVRPVCRTGIRDNAVYYDAVSLFSSKRDEFQDRIFKAIESNFKERGLIAGTTSGKESYPASVGKGGY